MKKLDDIMMNIEQRQALKELKRRLSYEFNIGDVILYGSVSRYEADNESDTDLLILTDYPMTRFERHKITDMIFEVNLLFGTNFSSLVIDRLSWNTGLVSVLPFHEEVCRDGIAL